MSDLEEKPAVVVRPTTSAPSARDPSIAPALDAVLAVMPRFTEPVTIEDMKAYKKHLAHALARPSSKLEVYRNASSGPVTVRFDHVVRLVDVV